MGYLAHRLRATSPPKARDSGPHRIACLALYRALIKLAPIVSLPSDIPVRRVNPLTHLIRKGFRRHVACSGKNNVVRALGVGYHAEQLLRVAASGSDVATSQIHRMLHLLEEKRTESATQPRPVRRTRPRVWPYSGAPKLLDVRPRPKVQLGGSGRRGVPILSSTNMIFFLRTKKPQSPYLTRVLRNKIHQRQQRANLEIELDDQKLTGKWEEQWDTMTVKKSEKPTGDLEKTWGAVVGDGLKDLARRRRNTVERNMEFGRRAVKLRDEERALQSTERRQRPQEKFLRRRRGHVDARKGAE